MKKERSVFQKYYLAVKKIGIGAANYKSAMDGLSELDFGTKEYEILRKKKDLYMKRINHNYAKCARYDAIIKFYGTFYQVEVLGNILAGVVTAVEGEAFHFVPMVENGVYTGLIVREYDGNAYVTLPNLGDEDYQDCRFYGSTYDSNNACLQVDFGYFSYLKDYIDGVINYRYKHQIHDDWAINTSRMNECYLEVFKEFLDSHRALIKDKHQYLDADEAQNYIDSFILERTVS